MSTLQERIQSSSPEIIPGTEEGSLTREEILEQMKEENTSEE